MRRTAIATAFALACTAGLLNVPVAAAAPAGTIEAVVPLPQAATLPGAAQASRILYRSTTANDAPTTASAAVYFPPGEPPAGGWPVIAWAHGTVGIGDDCAYSVAGPGAVERDWTYLDTWLQQGYAIVAADYAGLGTPGEHPYLNGIVEAHNVVDAVRAATTQYSSLAKKWVVIGQSQGGAAAVYTARYATEFGGPGLDYRGAVGTGVPAYIEEVLLPIGPHVPPVKLNPNVTTYVLYILNGLRTTYPELNIDSFLTDAGRSWVTQAREACLGPLSDAVGAAGMVIGDLFSRPLAQIPDLHGLLTRYLGLPESGYDKPVLLAQGLRDTDVITPQTLRFAAVLQANRQPVTLRTYPTDHSGTVTASLPDSLPFVRSLFG
ncbi:alpha/beta hydrolase family protein [Nocardia altamirensis]|uniref:alpha/beta hydrolase family protein n=1 Tax=Nocardia altamirensis TaxID=472158 RepID=UPI0008405574|nr:lipase family protein [Nocardia altamirensis]